MSVRTGLLLLALAVVLPSRAAGACTAYGETRRIVLTTGGQKVLPYYKFRSFKLDSPPTGCADVSLSLSNPVEEENCIAPLDMSDGEIPLALDFDKDGLSLISKPICSAEYESGDISSYRIPQTVTATLSGSAAVRIKSVFVTYAADILVPPYRFQFLGRNGAVDTATIDKATGTGLLVNSPIFLSLTKDFIVWPGDSFAISLLSSKTQFDDPNAMVLINSLEVELVQPPAATPPSAPIIDYIEVDGSKLLFAIDKPVSTGGAAITQYKVVATPPTGAAVQFTAAPTGINGHPVWFEVTNALSKYVQGMRYTFKAFAINAKGSGPASAGVPWRVPFQAGTYTLKLAGRASCAAKGFATAFACSAGNTAITLTTAGGARAKFELKPVKGTEVVDNAVLINASGRGTCAKVVQPDANTCSNTKVVAKAATTQQWVLEESGTSGQYLIRSVGRKSCATKYLGAKNTCGATTLEMVGASGAANLWTLAKA